MSYANLVNVSCADAEECFQRLRDFLCKRNGTYDYSTTGIGWTLHDSSYAVDEDTLTDGDYIIVYSPGESGDDDLYFELMYETTTNWLKIRGYLYWNNTTHAGVIPFYTSQYAAMTRGTTYNLFVYGDLDCFKPFQKYDSTYQGYYIGRNVDLLYDDTVATCAGALTAGSDVSIVLDDVPSTWVVGQAFFIRDTAGVEKATIKTISSNTITADLTNSYLAGSKSALDLSAVVPNSTFFGNGYGFISHNGDVGGSYTAMTATYTAHIAVSSNVPDLMNNDYLAGLIHMYDTNPDGYYGRLKDVYVTHSTGKTALDIFTDREGVEYRYLTHSSAFLLLKEV